MKKKLCILSIVAAFLCTPPLFADIGDEIKAFLNMQKSITEVVADVTLLIEEINNTIKTIKPLVSKVKSDPLIKDKIDNVNSIIKAIADPNFDQIANTIEFIGTYIIKPFNNDSGKTAEDAAHGIRDGTKFILEINKLVPTLAEDVQEIVDAIKEIEAATQEAS